MIEKEYWIFADESEQQGTHFSNFFGGLILPARNYQAVENRLRILKAKIGFIKELKWQRVSAHWLEGYKQIISGFFDELRSGQVRVRIMFRDNKSTPGSLTREQKEGTYFRLYYQFIKHAFGLAQIPEHSDSVRLRLFFDQFPDTREQAAQFKGYIAALPFSSDFRHQNILIDPTHITEIDSKEHVLLQCLDIVLGSMAFRLNEKHRVKPEGSRTRGKRTIAKDNLYRHILKEIQTLKPALNPKISTASEPFPGGIWSMPYRHWSFKPKK